MDEPFAALDEITRFKLNDDLLELWQDQRFTVVFVTHSVFESVFLSNRIVVMAARPGRVFDEIAVDAPYPRDDAFRTSPDYAALCRQASDVLVERDQRDGGSRVMTAIERQAAVALDPEEARRVRAERLERHRQMAAAARHHGAGDLAVGPHLRLERDPAIHPAAPGRGAADALDDRRRCCSARCW